MLVNPYELFTQLKSHCRTFVLTEPLEAGAGRYNFATEAPPSLPVRAQAEHPLGALESFLTDYDGRVLFCADSAGRRESLLELLGRIRVHPTVVDSWEQFLSGSDRLALLVAPLQQGLMLPEAGLAIISEAQLFGERIQHTPRRRTAQDNTELVVKNLTELSEIGRAHV